MLAEAAHKSKREVEQLVARLRPQPPIAPTIRRLPDPKPPVVSSDAAALEPASAARDSLTANAPAPVPPAVVKALAPERYKVQFTVSAETYDKLRRAQDLLRHTVPNGDLAVVFDRALTLLLGDLEKKKLAAAARPRAARSSNRNSRHIPAHVKRAVWERDTGRCAFVGTQGRCTETGLLEFHHAVPYAAGGSATVENVSLRCKRHNDHEAELFFGRPPAALVREPRDLWPVQTRSGPSP